MSLDLPAEVLLIRETVVSSTSDLAKDLARQGSQDKTLVWAQAQTGGRGRHGNSWVSEPGNLYMSMVLRPKPAPAHWGQLAFVAAVALAESLQKVLPDNVACQLKWPNDVLLNGKKVAGILLETETAGTEHAGWVVLGIGVNVAHAPPVGTALKDNGTDIKVEDMLSGLTHVLIRWLDIWQAQGFDPVHEAWLRYAAGVGEEIHVRLRNETFSGVFSGMDKSGALLLELKDGGQRKVTAGEVHFAPGR